MKKSFIYYLLFSIIATWFTSLALESKHREFHHYKEKELKVIISVAFGSISIKSQEEGNKITYIDYEEEEDDKNKLFISYDISDETGILRIKMKESSLTFGDNKKRDDKNIEIGLTTRIPISFVIEFGAGNGKIDLTDIQVKNLKISTGASDVKIKCNKPNPIVLEELSIESGVSKFSGSNLGNLRFKNFKFSGGLGSYKLDLNGAHYNKAKLKVEIGLGSININAPNNIPTKIICDDNWLTSLKIDDEFEKTRKGTYETDDFDEESNHLIINVSSGMGSVKITRK